MIFQACMTGLFGGRWKRYQQSKDDTGKVSWEQLNISSHLEIPFVMFYDNNLYCHVFMNKFSKQIRETLFWTAPQLSEAKELWKTRCRSKQA